MLLVPALQLTVFGYAINMDIKNTSDGRV